MSQNSEKNAEKLRKITRKKKPYRVDIKFPNGDRVTKTFHRKFDAEQFRAKMLVKKQNIEEYGTDIDKDITFDKFVKYWFKNEVEGRKAPKTQKGYETNIRKYILPILGGIKLRHISYQHARTIENFCMKEGRTNRTTNKILMQLKTILNDAVKHSFLLKSPIRGYPELKEEPRHYDFWSKEEILKFLNANKEDYFIDLYTLVLNTGLRLGEVCGLCWDRVNFESDTITISRTLTREGLKNTTKTHKARYIPMNTKTKAVLLKRFQAKSQKLVFHMPDGSPITYDHFTQRQFKYAQLRAKLDRKIRFHDLRHTYASHFVMNGGDIYVLQKLLGHTDISTTMIYAHLSENFLKQATEIVNF